MRGTFPEKPHNHLSPHAYRVCTMWLTNDNGLASTQQQLNGRHRTPLAMFLRFRNSTVRQAAPQLCRSWKPRNTATFWQVYQASPHVSTARHKHTAWGGKAWEWRYILVTSHKTNLKPYRVYPGAKKGSQPFKKLVIVLEYTMSLATCTRGMEASEQVHAAKDCSHLHQPESTHLCQKLVALLAPTEE